MLIFYQSQNSEIYAVKLKQALLQGDDEKLVWLFGNAKHLSEGGLRKACLVPHFLTDLI